MSDKKLRMLIIDDEMPKHKGYDRINKMFPDVFEIDKCKSYNALSYPPNERSLELIRTRQYDIILLDYVLTGQSDQGDDILGSLREGLREYPDIPHEEGNLNRYTYVIGVSEEWRRNDQGDWIGIARKPINNFLYVDGKRPEELFEVLGIFLGNKRD